MHQYADLEWHLTKKDLAKVFDVCYRSIERYIKTKELPEPNLWLGDMPRWGISYLNKEMLNLPNLASGLIIHNPIYKGKKIKRGTFELVPRSNLSIN